MAQESFLTEEVKEYLTENHKDMSAINMANNLGISISTINNYLRKLGLRALNTTKKLTPDKEVIIKENYLKVELEELSSMVDLSIPYLKRYIEYNCEEPETEIIRDYNLDDGNGNFDVNLFANICYY